MRPVKFKGASKFRLIVGLVLITSLLLSCAETSAAATWMNRVIGVDLHDAVANSDGSSIVFGVGPGATNVLAKLGADGAVQWAKKFSTPAGMPYGGGGPLAQTSDGGVMIIAGWQDGVGGQVSVIAKVDTNGALVWQLAVPSWGYSGIMVDGGFLYLATSSENGGGVGEIIAAKVDLARMSFVWAKVFTMPVGVDPYNPTKVGIYRLKRDLDGGLLMPGSLSISNGTGVRDGLLFKVSTAGTVVFSKRLWGPGFNRNIRDVVPLSDGYAFAGYTSEGAESANIWVGNISTAWSFRWQKSLGGCSRDWAQRIVKMSDGSLLIGARSWPGSSNDALAVNVGSSNAWSLNWQKRYWTLDDDGTNGIAETSDHGMLLFAGLEANDRIFGGPSEVLVAGLLIKTDASGVIAASGCGNIPCPAVTDGLLGVTDTTAGVEDFVPAAEAPLSMAISTYGLILEDAAVSSNKLCGN